jgi:signal transduction histidine kinase
MAEYWNDFDGAMADAAAGLLRAAEGLHQAIMADQRLREASRKAREEQGDLRETVARLEGLVLEQQQDIRALREEIRERGNRNGRL